MEATMKVIITHYYLVLCLMHFSNACEMEILSPLSFSISWHISPTSLILSPDLNVNLLSAYRHTHTEITKSFSRLNQGVAMKQSVREK
jgi:hypothetical protein